MKKIIKEKVSIIGLTTRTNNANQGKDIMMVWEKFNELGLQPADGKFYAIYYNYESDHTGDYDFLVGVENTGNVTIENAQTVAIAPGEYTEFPIEGKMPQAVFSTRQTVWSSDIQRSYITDFEEYYFDGKNPPKAKIFIG